MFHAKVGHGGGDQITLVAATRYLLKTAMETLKLSLHDGALAVPSPGNVGPALEDKLGKKIRKKNIDYLTYLDAQGNISMTIAQQKS